MKRLALITVVIFRFISERFCLYTGHLLLQKNPACAPRTGAVGRLFLIPIVLLVSVKSIDLFHFCTIHGISYSGTNKYYYVIAVVFPICYFLMKRLVRSPYGLAVQGMRDNARKMEAIGFNTKAIRVVLFTISGFFTAISGVMLTTFYSSMGPDYVNSKQSLLCLFMAVLGGIGHIEGALVGAAVYILLENFISEYTIYYSAVLGVIFTLTLSVLDRRKEENEEHYAQESVPVSYNKQYFVKIVLLFVFSSAGGLLFDLILHISAGGILGSMLFAALYCCLTDVVIMPRCIVSAKQIIQGGYSGSLVTAAILTSASELILPLMIEVIFIITYTLCTGWILWKVFHYRQVFSLIVPTPGGIGEIASVSDALGEDTASIVVVQTVRLFYVLSILPVIIQSIL